MMTAQDAAEVEMMGNDELEILSCGIPGLSKQVATRKAQQLADYPLARASEWAPLPAGAIQISASSDENEELAEELS
jgi:hypothetical protein